MRDLKKNNLTNKGKKRLFVFLFLAPVMTCFAVFNLYPLITVFVTSFCEWNYKNITAPKMLPIQEIFKNYQYIFTIHPNFYEALKNSIGWAFCGLFIQVPLATMIALTFSRKLHGWKLARNVFIIPNVISSAALSMIMLQLYNPRYGLINPIIQLFNPAFAENILYIEGVNFFAILFAYVFFLGTVTVMLMGQIAAVPKEVIEAAEIDGAQGFKLDFKIVVPCIKESIKTIAVLAVTSGFLLYNEVFFLTKGAAGTYSISYLIRDIAITSQRSNFARANAIGVVQIIVGLILVGTLNGLFKMDFSARKVKNISRGIKE